MSNRPSVAQGTETVVKLQPKKAKSSQEKPAKGSFGFPESRPLPRRFSRGSAKG